MSRRQRPRRALMAAIAAALLASAAFAAPATRSLEDQFGREVEVRIGAGKAALAIMSDVRDAAEEISSWVEALDGLPSSVDVFRIADLKALPFFIPRGAITKDLRDKHPDTIILLDWKGEVSAALRAPRKTTAVLVFGPDGSELGRVEGRSSLSGAAAIKAFLARMK
jgi:hypothetical protein